MGAAKVVRLLHSMLRGGGVRAMCHALSDPKYMLCDRATRVTHLSFEQDIEKLAAPTPLAGLFAHLRDAASVLLKKDRAHV